MHMYLLSYDFVASKMSKHLVVHVQVCSFIQTFILNRIETLKTSVYYLKQSQNIKSRIRL